MYRAIAKKVFTFTSDAPDDISLIAAIDGFSDFNGDGGLDSLDLGDALGYMIKVLEDAQKFGDGDHLIVTPEGITLTISFGWEPFDWNPQEPPNTLGNAATG